MKDIDLLKSLLDRIKKLKYRDYHELDDIKRKTKMVLANMFPLRSYSSESEHIKFERTYFNQMPVDTYISDWAQGISQFHNLIHTAITDYEMHLSDKEKSGPQVIERVVTVQDDSMIDEVKNEFSSYRRNVRKWVIFSVLFIISTTLIWIIFRDLNWTWYANHSKKTAITLMSNLTVLALLLNVPFRNKWLVWTPIAFAVVIALFSLL